VIVLLCSGQGAQNPEMFRLTAAAPCAASVFEAASAALGQDARAFVQSASPPELFANRPGQILCVTQALAVHALIRETLTEPFILLGYSVGELAACSIAGLLEPGEVLRLAGCRAALMDAVSEPNDGLVVVRGLTPAYVGELARDAGVEIAIVNPCDTFIVGGRGRDLGQFCTAARAAGASRCERIRVAVASHTRHMIPAAADLHEQISRCPARPLLSGITLLSGTDGSNLPDASAAGLELARQIYTPIAWVECLHAACERGGHAFLELGPGHALRDMVRSAYPGWAVRTADDFVTAEGLRTWIQRAIDADS
jgi:[acyl-carrier-protein] S-malonyltransferase